MLLTRMKIAKNSGYRYLPSVARLRTGSALPDNSGPRLPEPIQGRRQDSQYRDEEVGSRRPAVGPEPAVIIPTAAGRSRDRSHRRVTYGAHDRPAARDTPATSNMAQKKPTAADVNTSPMRPVWRVCSCQRRSRGMLRVRSFGTLWRRWVSLCNRVLLVMPTAIALRGRHRHVTDAGLVSLMINVPHKGEMVVNTVSDGELLGFSALLSRHRWRSTARVSQTTRCLHFKGEELRKLMELDHELGYQLLQVAFRVATERMGDSFLRILDVFGDKR